MKNNLQKSHFTVVHSSVLEFCRVHVKPLIDQPFAVK